jgi:hypothetical protein
MKCIKRGRPPEHRIWHGECHNCNSVFEALEAELTNIENDFSLCKENARFARAMCEICKSNFVLYPVKANAQDYYNK